MNFFRWFGRKSTTDKVAAMLFVQGFRYSPQTNEAAYAYAASQIMNGAGLFAGSGMDFVRIHKESGTVDLIGLVRTSGEDDPYIVQGKISEAGVSIIRSEKAVDLLPRMQRQKDILQVLEEIPLKPCIVIQTVASTPEAV